MPENRTSAEGKLTWLHSDGRRYRDMRKACLPYTDDDHGARIGGYQLPAEEQTAGGIILPTDSQDQPLAMEVYVVGDRCEMEIKPGDIALVGKYTLTGLQVGIYGPDAKIVNCREILSITPREQWDAEQAEIVAHNQRKRGKTA